MFSIPKFAVLALGTLLAVVFITFQTTTKATKGAKKAKKKAFMNVENIIAL